VACANFLYKLSGEQSNLLILWEIRALPTFCAQEVHVPDDPFGGLQKVVFFQAILQVGARNVEKLGRTSLYII
jgi:hypothetical protein